MRVFELPGFSPCNIDLRSTPNTQGPDVIANARARITPADLITLGRSDRIGSEDWTDRVVVSCCKKTTGSHR